jgi:hypothetical protein
MPAEILERISRLMPVGPFDDQELTRTVGQNVERTLTIGRVGQG